MDAQYLREKTPVRINEWKDGETVVFSVQDWSLLTDKELSQRRYENFGYSNLFKVHGISDSF